VDEMAKRKSEEEEKKVEEMITNQIRDSYESGLIEPEIDTRAKEKNEA
jgi:hypothetical protein